MQLGEFVQISEELIERTHEVCGDKKQRYAPDCRYTIEGSYASMYPITKDTKLFCMHINPDNNTASCYIPYGEPLSRKYPKRTLKDSFVPVHQTCVVSVVDRIVDIRELSHDVKVAYLCYLALRCITSGIFNFTKQGRGSLAEQTDSARRLGDTSIRQIVEDNDESAVKSFLDFRQIRLGSLLANGLNRANGPIGYRYRNAFGNILEDLFNLSGLYPIAQQPTKITSKYSQSGSSELPHRKLKMAYEHKYINRIDKAASKLVHGDIPPDEPPSERLRILPPTETHPEVASESSPTEAEVQVAPDGFIQQSSPTAFPGSAWKEVALDMRDIRNDMSEGEAANVFDNMYGTLRETNDDGERRIDREDDRAELELESLESEEDM